MSNLRTSADRTIRAALDDAENGIAAAADLVPEAPPATWEGRAIDNLCSAQRALLIALTECFSELRAGPPGPQPDELASAEGAVINAAYHLALCQPPQVDEMIRQLVAQVRRHHAAVSALAGQGGGG